jgi:hypothetical protein
MRNNCPCQTCEAIREASRMRKNQTTGTAPSAASLVSLYAGTGPLGGVRTLLDTSTAQAAAKQKVEDQEFPHGHNIYPIIHEPGVCKTCDKYPQMQKAWLRSEKPFTKDGTDGWGNVYPGDPYSPMTPERFRDRLNGIYAQHKDHDPVNCTVVAQVRALVRKFEKENGDAK